MTPSSAATAKADPEATHTKIFLTVTIGGQAFGIPVLQVQDVLGEQAVTRIPLAPPQIAGSLNLRGRIVTAVDVRKCLGLPPSELKTRPMSVVVEQDGELYSLIIDTVGDVLPLPDENFEANPPTLDLLWRSVSVGVYRLDNNLLIVLDVAKLLLSLSRPH